MGSKKKKSWRRLMDLALNKQKKKLSKRVSKLRKHSLKKKINFTKIYQRRRMKSLILKKKKKNSMRQKNTWKKLKRAPHRPSHNSKSLRLTKISIQLSSAMSSEIAVLSNNGAPKLAEKIKCSFWNNRISIFPG